MTLLCPRLLPGSRSRQLWGALGHHRGTSLQWDPAPSWMRRMHPWASWGTRGTSPTSWTAHKARAVARMRPAPAGNSRGGVLGWEAKVPRDSGMLRRHPVCAPRGAEGLCWWVPRDPQNPPGLHGELRGAQGAFAVA